MWKIIEKIARAFKRKKNNPDIMSNGEDIGKAVATGAVGIAIAAGIIGLIKLFSDINRPPKERCWYCEKLINRNSTICPYCFKAQYE